MRDTLVGAINTQLMQAGDEVVSIYHRRIEHGYPTPSLGRDEVLDKALPWLQQHNIWSRGRFGSYKVGNGCRMLAACVKPLSCAGSKGSREDRGVSLVGKTCVLPCCHGILPALYRVFV